MLHRIFIAISLPDKVKKELTKEQDRITAMFPSKCPVSWTRKENLHITVSFIGSVTNDELMEVIKITERVASRHEPFGLSLTNVIYGPYGCNPAQIPRMIWATGEKSKELALLRNDLENSLSEEQGPALLSNEKALAPHVTLGRVMAWEYRTINVEERPDIKRNILLDLGASSIDVMESELKRTGARYNLLGSFPLTKLE
jgi:2'-5' RNA ligase